MKDINITMLGARGVGKSSLLSSMYYMFTEVAGDTGLDLKPLDGGTSATLANRHEQMLDQLSNLQGRGGMTGDEEASEYCFQLGVRGKPADVRLNFYDFPGEWIEGENENRGRVIEQLKKSSTILLAIDTPPLMIDDCYGRWEDFHGKINRDKLILDLFKEIPREQLSKKLILLTPLKCETWVKNSRDCDLLVSRVKEGYRPLLAEFDYYNNITVAITPVQTLGNLNFRFRKLVGDAGKQQIKDEFRPHKPDNFGRAKYQPYNIEQPLIYMLSFLLQQIQDECKWQRNNEQMKLNDRSIFVKLLENIFSIDNPSCQKITTFEEIMDRLIEPLAKLANKRLEGGRDGVHILQGKQHLVRRV